MSIGGSQSENFTIQQLREFEQSQQRYENSVQQGQTAFTNNVYQQSRPEVTYQSNPQLQQHANTHPMSNNFICKLKL